MATPLGNDHISHLSRELRVQSSFLKKTAGEAHETGLETGRIATIHEKPPVGHLQMGHFLGEPTKSLQNALQGFK